MSFFHRLNKHSSKTKSTSREASSSSSQAPRVGSEEKARDNLPHYEVHKGTFHMVTVAAVQNLLFMMRVAKWKKAYSQGQTFSRKMQLPYFCRVRAGEDLSMELNKVIDETFPITIREFVDINARCKELITALQADSVSVLDLVELLDKAYEINVEAHDRLGAMQFLPVSRPGSRAGSRSVSRAGSQVDLTLKNDAPGPPDLSALTADKFAEKETKVDDDCFQFSVIKNPDRLSITWPKAWGEEFLGAAMQNAQRLRNIEEDPTMVDFMTFGLADYLLSQGGNPSNSKKARFLGTVGFRPYTNTYLSLTDPGDGHVFGTTRKSRWMKGAIVHVEHLERPQNLSRDFIESYRVPSIYDFARVRLHTGYESPNTYFVGRALKDSGTFEFDYVKVVNTTSAAASAAFQLGATECKIAMDGLKSSQMVAYMRGMGGHALKNHKQYLSAAFNLNYPITDDLIPGEDGNPRKLVDQMDIGRRAVELAILGGFEKCTWDGASDTYPSKCIILQLGFQNALELVHRAHSVGLTTYMSAGFKFQHIADAVYAGVDGIGIGGAQILRYMDYETGMHGPYTEEFIDKIQEARDEAAESLRGQGVALLCRLDLMHFELSITEAEEKLRDELYEALRAADEAKIKELMSGSTAEAVRALPTDGETPFLARARRTIAPRDGQYSILRGAARALLDGQTMWAGIVHDLEGLLAISDDAGVYSYTTVAPWTTLLRAARKSYRPGEIYRTHHYTLKTTPYGGDDNN